MDDHFIKVLLIEDNGCDARLVQELLKEVSSVQFELEHVERIRDGLQRLNETSFDVILLDFRCQIVKDLKHLVIFIGSSMIFRLSLLPG